MSPRVTQTDPKTVRDSPPRSEISEKSGPKDPVQLLAEHANVFDISQDAIFLWREPGGIQFWNHAAAELYGYTKEQALGRDAHELLRTQFPDSLGKLEQALRTHGSWEGELQQRKADGGEIIASARMKTIEQDVKTLLVLESTRDISEARRNQERLQRHLREQAVTARFSLDALEATNVQTILDDAVHIAARELGADLSAIFEIQADGTRMLLRSGWGWRPGYVGVAFIDVSEASAAGRAVILNQPIMIEDVRRDAQLRPPDFMREHGVISSMRVTIRGRDKRPFGVLSVDKRQPHAYTADELNFIEDLSNILATAISRIQFEQESRETAARLRGIVETAVDGIITIDERGIVETINPAAERIFGFPADEVVGRNVSMLMPEPYRSEHDDYLERYRRTGERRIIGIGREVRGRRKDGTQFPLDLAVSATNLGTRRIFTGLVRDITARKQLEQEILEISDREQRRIGSDLHDDLCQRLAGIRFATDALRKSTPTAPANAIVTRLEKIGADVSDAIDRTRMLARGMSPVALERNGLVSALEELTASMCKIFGVQCSFHADENVSVADPIAATHLYRIAQEAMNNALKHADSKQITVSIENAGDRAVMTIADDGKGFAVDGTNGTAQGMGLRTIAYRAGLIDASVEVSSAPGRGTKIICTFSSRL